MHLHAIGIGQGHDQAYLRDLVITSGLGSYAPIDTIEQEAAAAGNMLALGLHGWVEKAELVIEMAPGVTCSKVLQGECLNYDCCF
jgi:hypothetical protein